MESRKNNRQYKGLGKNHGTRKLVITCVIVAFIVTIILIVPSRVAYADQEKQNTRLYKTIEIMPGDSLWSIASDNYTEECKSMSDYIYLIKKCNSLYDDKLTAGCYLVIPYYESV